MVNTEAYKGQVNAGRRLWYDLYDAVCKVWGSRNSHKIVMNTQHMELIKCWINHMDNDFSDAPDNGGIVSAWGFQIEIDDTANDWRIEARDDK